MSTPFDSALKGVPSTNRCAEFDNKLEASIGKALVSIAGADETDLPHIMEELVERYHELCDHYEEELKSAPLSYMEAVAAMEFLTAAMTVRTLN